MSLKASHNLTDKLSITTGWKDTALNTKGRYGTGYDPRNVFQSFGMFFQTNLDFERLKNYRMTDGSHNTWNKIYWTDPTPLYFNNPYWERYENFQTDRRNRFFGYIRLDYQITDWLNVHYQVSSDFWSNLQEERYAVGSVSNFFFDPDRELTSSDYTKRVQSYNEINHEFIASFQHAIGKNISISAILGGNIRKNRIDMSALSTRNGLVVENLYSISNSASNEIQSDDQLIRLEQQSIFGQVNLGLFNQLFLDFTARNDWSTTLPPDNNRYFSHRAS